MLPEKVQEGFRCAREGSSKYWKVCNRCNPFLEHLLTSNCNLKELAPVQHLPSMAGPWQNRCWLLMALVTTSSSHQKIASTSLSVKVRRSNRAPICMGNTRKHVECISRHTREGPFSCGQTSRACQEQSRKAIQMLELVTGCPAAKL